jgi:hypothetical protein
MQRLDGLLKDGGELARTLLHRHTGPGEQAAVDAAERRSTRCCATLSPTEQDGVVAGAPAAGRGGGAARARRRCRRRSTRCVEKSAAGRFLARATASSCRTAGAAQEQRLACW